MVLALHGVVLEYLRRQLSSEVMVITPMPQPLLVHVLRPVATVLPPPVVRPPAKAPQPVRSSPVAAAAQAPDGADRVADAAIEPGAQEALQGAEDAPDVAPMPNVEPSTPESPSLAVEAPDAWPVDTRLSYSVKGYYRGDFYGWGQVQWQHNEGRYQVQVDMRLALLFTGTLVSQGELSAQGLQPRVYEERGMGRARQMVFDGAMVTLSDGSQLPQPQGVQDTASQFVDLTHRFSSGRQALLVGAEVPVWLARPREMMLWTYDVVALETLQLPELGEVPAFHLKPRPLVNARGMINAELWFAPSLQYLPVRIRVNLGNDNYVELTVKRIEQGVSSAAVPQ